MTTRYNNKATREEDGVKNNYEVKTMLKENRPSPLAGYPTDERAVVLAAGAAVNATTGDCTVNVRLPDCMEEGGWMDNCSVEGYGS